MGSMTSWGNTGGGGGTPALQFERVPSHTQLPNPTTALGQIYVTEATMGTGTGEKTAGLYIATNTGWKYLGDTAFTATQVIHTPVAGFTSPNVDGVIAEIAGKLASLVSGLSTETTNREQAVANHTHTIAAITGLSEALADTARALHAHAIGDVTGLQTALDGKTAVGHGHAIADTTGLSAALDGKTAVGHGHIIGDISGLTTELSFKAPTVHGHVISDTTGLQLALDGKAAVGHVHAIADTTGLQVALDGKAVVGHVHAIGDVTGLQTALNGRALTVHTHAISEVVGLTEELDAIKNTPPSNHVHSIAQVTGLQLALDGKTATGHTHVMADVTDLQAALDLKSPTSHVHAISGVTGLQLALDGKTNNGHGHAIGDITGLTFALSEKAAVAHGHVIGNITGLQAELDNKAVISHGHIIGDITGLQIALDGKALTAHSHTISDVTGLQVQLDGKATTTHGHVISDVSGLQLALDAKAAVAHGHVIGDITGLQTALNAKSPLGHVHAIADITGLQVELDGKAAVSHVHIIADVTGLQVALDGKQPSGSYSLTGHSHVIGDVTGLQTALNAKEPTIAAGLAAQYWNGLKAWATLDKIAVGLANVDNTSDANKPISTATQTALNAKEPTITGGTGAQYWTGLKAWATLDKTAVGLANVDNTSDANKPISTATQTALNGKQASGSYSLTGHSHVIADVTGLQVALDGKQASGSYSLTGHSHVIADVTGLQTAIDGKAATGHVHAVATTTVDGFMSAADKTKLNGLSGSLFTNTTSGLAPASGGGTTNFLRADGTWAAPPSGGGAGTVTSVSGTGTVSGLSLSGTVTASGNLTLGGTLAVVPANFASQAANTVLASPNGAAGAPTFRTLVAADIPTLNQNTTGSAASLTTGRTIGMTGDVVWTSASFDGSANVTGTSTIGNNVVTLAKLAQVATGVFLGRVTATTGNVEALTGTQATSLLDIFTTALKGVVPASGGGTTNFLRADGTWAAPPAGGGSAQDPVLTLTAPTNPAADTAKMYGRKFGRIMPGWLQPDGNGGTVQPHLGRNRISRWQANGNTLLSTLDGLVAGTNVGTPVAIAVATTNRATRIRRISYPTTATAGTLGGHYLLNQSFWSVGNAASPPTGGFFFSIDFVPFFAAANAGARYFLGMVSASGAPTNVEPSLQNQIGIGKITASANLHILVGGAVANTPIDLGVNFPAVTNRTKAYRATFYCPPTQAGVINYTVEDLVAGTITSGTITPVTVGQQTPDPVVTLQPRWWVTNNIVAAIGALDVSQFYIETDN